MPDDGDDESYSIRHQTSTGTEISSRNTERLHQISNINNAVSQRSQQ